jgi:class 3 adenylate cyclase/CheY-like chemotaxis protein
MREGRGLAAIVFTDLVGSTELFARVGSVRAHEVQLAHFTLLRGRLGLHRGQEVKTLGDGMMAAFPSADDAIACAVAMQRAAVTQRVETGRPQTSRIAMRVGVSAGDVTYEDGDYFGRPVVEASRLCSLALADQILVGEVIRLLAGDQGPSLQPVGARLLKGISEPVLAWEVEWSPDEPPALRVALAEDSALLRQGIAQVLEDEGIHVVAQAGDADTLLWQIVPSRPDVVVLDVRMPPTHTDEGIRAAERILDEHPHVGVLLLSASIDTAAARRVLREGARGIGYLLKDRVADVGELMRAIRSVADGGCPIDPQIARLGWEPGRLT